VRDSIIRLFTATSHDKAFLKEPTDFLPKVNFFTSVHFNPLVPRPYTGHFAIEICLAHENSALLAA
jgi:hypothetical protein